MAKYAIEDTTLTGIADAIRDKTFSTDTVAVNEMSSLIRSIKAGAELTIVATVESGATVTATKGDTSVTAVSVDGVATLKVPEGGAWSVVATLNGQNSVEMTVEVATSFDTKLEFIPVYGAEWDGSSNPAWVRTDYAADFADPVPYMAGATTYGSPFDNIMPWSGMEVVEDAEAGTLVKIPKFYYKWTRNGAAMKLQIANEPVKGFFVSPAHADRGDGKGERDFVYVGRYHCGETAYKSVSGQLPKVYITRDVARTNIAALGDAVWQFDHAMIWTIRMLYLVEFANWNSQGTIGRGCGIKNAGVKNVGASDSMPYHTGTMMSSRTAAGLGCQYRHIEGLWENCFDWCDGVYYDNSGTIYGIQNPANFSDSSGGANIGVDLLPSSDVECLIKEWTASAQEGFEWCLYPAVADGTTYTTYSCDGYTKYTGGGLLNALIVGGCYMPSNDQGLFLLWRDNADYTDDIIGCRLMKLP